MLKTVTIFIAICIFYTEVKGQDAQPDNKIETINVADKPSGQVSNIAWPGITPGYAFQNVPQSQPSNLANPSYAGQPINNIGGQFPLYGQPLHPNIKTEIIDVPDASSGQVSSNGQTYPIPMPVNAMNPGYIGGPPSFYGQPIQTPIPTEVAGAPNALNGFPASTWPYGAPNALQSYPMPASPNAMNPGYIGGQSPFYGQLIQPNIGTGMVNVPNSFYGSSYKWPDYTNCYQNNQDCNYNYNFPCNNWNSGYNLPYAYSSACPSYSSGYYSSPFTSGTFGSGFPLSMPAQVSIPQFSGQMSMPGQMPIPGQFPIPSPAVLAKRNATASNESSYISVNGQSPTNNLTFAQPGNLKQLYYSNVGGTQETHTRHVELKPVSTIMTRYFGKDGKTHLKVITTDPDGNTTSTTSEHDGPIDLNIVNGIVKSSGNNSDTVISHRANMRIGVDKKADPNSILYEPEADVIGLEVDGVDEEEEVENFSAPLDVRSWLKHKMFQ